MSSPLIVFNPVSQCFTDYSAFRFRAEVDWIELRIVTLTPTNFQTVNRRMGVGYAKPDDKGAGGAATEFTVKIQAPKSWADINQRIGRLVEDHPLAEPIMVTGIEIALDAYSKKQDREELVEMALHFYRGAAKVVSTNRRASKTKTDTSYSLALKRNVRQLLMDGYNLYIADQSSDESQHIYVKETDRKAILPVDQQRARTEFTLREQRIADPQFSNWSTHDFTQYASYFKYRQLRSHLPLVVATAATTLAQIGERRERRTRSGNKRHFSRLTTADLKLNALAFDALRELNRRWKAKT